MTKQGTIQSIAAAVIAASGLAMLFAQSAVQAPPSPPANTHMVPPAIPPAPFAPHAQNDAAAVSIEFRPATHMSEPDRALAANAASAIAEHAAHAGFDLNAGDWRYQQIMCPSLPGHLFLQYMRNGGSGDLTVFSASVPRNQMGQVRIVPILRRSYSLFSPAPINALTISAFNHIRAEEDDANAADWLGTGLCYAALAGAHPRVPLPQPEFVVGSRIPEETAHLDTHFQGGEVIHFADAAALPRPMEWSMTFTAQGKLVKATHVPATLDETRPMPKQSPVSRTWTVPKS